MTRNIGETKRRFVPSIACGDINMRAFSLRVLLLVMWCSSASVFAAGGSHYTARSSDPVALGWMQGAPPPSERLIMQPQSDYFSFPKLRWTVCHIRELLPTKQVSRGLGAPIPLAYDLDTEIDKLVFTPLGQQTPTTWRESLELNFTDGLVILHRGKVVYESYSGCLTERGKHAAMSMTKSLTGLLAEILIAEGQLDAQARVVSVVPEFKGSAFAEATVRQVMDMTTALDYSEDYSDPNADIWLYSAAASPLPKSADYSGPNGYFEYLKTLKQDGEHGLNFGYKTVNTDALGWIIARSSGKDVATLLSEKVWSKLGMEQDAYMTVDAKGTPFAGGGLSAGLRDLARLGQTLLDGGVFNGKRIFPESVLQTIRKGGDKEAFRSAGYAALEGGSYSSMWWLLHNQNGAFAARGVHGQTLYIDPAAEMVIVRYASFPQAKNAAIDPTSLPAYQAVADYLMMKKTSWFSW
jgi:CubicO group peptidase (beta-lactamase class C family)